MCTGRKWSGRPDKGAPGTVDGEAAGETSTGPPRSTTDNRLLPTHAQNTKKQKVNLSWFKNNEKFKRAPAAAA